MTNFADLQKWASDGEAPTLEFKLSVPSDAGKSISAFANTAGGILVFGVEPKAKKFEGVRDADAESRRIREALDRCRPQPQTSQEFVRHEGKVFILLLVEQMAYSQNPCEFDGHYYLRQGTTNTRLTGEERIEFLRRRSVLSFEESRSHATLQDLDSNKLQNFFRARKVDVNIGNDEELKARLAALRAANFNGSFFLKNLSTMFFASDPTKFYSNLEVRIVKYKGTEKKLEALVSDERLVNTAPELIEATFRNISNQLPKQYKLVGTKREELEYPEEALREAIVNAIGHRDYFDNQDVLLEIFDDRLIMTNPGGLLPGQTQANFDHNPKHRNPLTYRMLHDLKLGEGLGMGIQKIRTQFRQARLPDPEFINLGSAFQVVLYNNSSRNKRYLADFENDRQKQLIAYVETHKTIKTKQFSKLVGVSGPTAIKDLNELIKQGKIHKVGKYRGAYYELAKL